MKRNHRSPIVRASLVLAVLQGAAFASAQAEAPPTSETEGEPSPDHDAETQEATTTEAETPDATTTPTEPRFVAGALIQHAPLNHSYFDDARFLFEVKSPDRAGTIVVRVVPDASPTETIELEATLVSTGYVAVLPRTQVTAPGFAYHVVERMRDGTERPVFADVETPHHVRVTRTEADDLQQERLEQHGGNRSTVSLSAEGVDYGDRTLVAGQGQVHDRYYKLEVGYAYSFFTTIEDVRISLVRVRGQAAVFNEWPMPQSTEIALGIDYGRAAVTLVAHENARLRGAVLLGASQKGFEYGAAASIVIGNPLGSNIDIGAEALTTLGTVTHLRLGFAATPAIPMGAAIEASSFPVGEDFGVRLLYDIGYRFDPVTAVTLRGGYQARTSVTGGVSLGLNVDYGF